MMDDLIARLEKVTGPDESIDAEIGLMMGWQRGSRSTNLVTGLPMPTVHYWLDPNNDQDDLPCYTASIDAALSLVPEGYAIERMMIWPGEPSSVTVLGARREAFGKDRRIAWVHSGGLGRWTVDAATPAIALCIAALKARKQ